MAVVVMRLLPVVVVKSRLLVVDKSMLVVAKRWMQVVMVMSNLPEVERPPPEKLVEESDLTNFKINRLSHLARLIASDSASNVSSSTICWFSFNSCYS